VRLGDAAGAAHHGGNARALENARFGAEGDQRGLPGAGQALRQAGHVVAGRAQEGRHLANRFKAEARVRRDFLHRGLHAFRVGPYFLLHGQRVGAGQVAEFIAELGVARHHVVGDAAVELPDAGGAEGHVETLVARLVGLKALGHVAQLADHARRHLDGIDRLRRERGVRLLAAHAAFVAVDALVRGGRHHAGGLADDAGQRRDAGVLHVGDQLAHAQAADFLVVTERQMHRERRLAVQEIAGVGQRHADKTLHVAAAAAVEPAVADRSRQRVQRPVLAVPGHGVGVARQDDAGRLALAQRGKEVGLGLAGIGGDAAGHAQPGEFVAHEMDQFQVAVVADRVHAHQGLDQFQGAGRDGGQGGGNGGEGGGGDERHGSILAVFGDVRCLHVSYA
jgi:hypothetical protein